MKKDLRKILSIVVVAIMVLSFSLAISAEQSLIVPAATCSHASTKTVVDGPKWGGSSSHPLYDSAGNIVASCNVGVYYTTITQVCLKCGATVSIKTNMDYQHSICR